MVIVEPGEVAVIVIVLYPITDVDVDDVTVPEKDAEYCDGICTIMTPEPPVPPRPATSTAPSGAVSR